MAEIWTYVKDLSVKSSSKCRKYVRANELFVVEWKMRKNGKTEYTRSPFHPSSDDPSEVVNKVFGMVEKDKMVLHIVLFIKKGSELQCRTEVRAKKPRDVTFPKGYFEDVKIPLSKFTTKEDMKKAKSDKIAAEVAKAVVQKNSGHEALQRFDELRKNENNLQELSSEVSSANNIEPDEDKDYMLFQNYEDEDEENPKFPEPEDKNKELDEMKSKVALYTRALVKAASENKRMNTEREELERQKGQLLREKEELIRENEELKRKTSSPAAVDKYFEIINARLENIQQGIDAQRTGSSNGLKTLKYALELEEENKASVILGPDDIYCGHGFGVNGKGIVSRAALLEIEMNSENFTQRALQISEMVLGESLSKFSLSGSCQADGRTVKKLPQDAMRAVRSILRSMDVSYMRGKEHPITGSNMSDFFRTQPSEERRKERKQAGGENTKKRKLNNKTANKDSEEVVRSGDERPPKKTNTAEDSADLLEESSEQLTYSASDDLLGQFM